MKFRPQLTLEAVTFDELNALSSAPNDALYGHVEWQGHACTKENATCWLVPHASLNYVPMMPSDMLVSTGDRFPIVMSAVDFFNCYEPMPVETQMCAPSDDLRCQPAYNPREQLKSMNGIETIALLAFIQDCGLRLK